MVSRGYFTKGTCSKIICYDVDDGRLRNVEFIGGCDGNTKGVSRLVEGMAPSDVISRLRGVNCGTKGTSCPDQLARALQDPAQPEQLLLGLYERFNDPEFQKSWHEVGQWEWKDYDDYLKKYGADPKASGQADMVSTFFEGMGALAKRGIIDIAQVDDAMSKSILSYWRKFGPVYTESRKKLGPTRGRYTEYLCNEVQRYE